jgi:hypothetical protein
MIGDPTAGTFFDGLAALTDDELNEMTETTAKIPARAIFLSIGFSFCCRLFVLTVCCC